MRQVRTRRGPAGLARLMIHDEGNLAGRLPKSAGSLACSAPGHSVGRQKLENQQGARPLRARRSEKGMSSRAAVRPQSCQGMWRRQACASAEEAEASPCGELITGRDEISPVKRC